MRLIDADKIDFSEVFVGASDFAKDTRAAAQMLIDEQPTVDPMKHSGWALIRNGLRQCKNCYFDRPAADLAWSYCPYCGAKMDL